MHLCLDGLSKVTDSNIARFVAAEGRTAGCAALFLNYLSAISCQSSECQLQGTVHAVLHQVRALACLEDDLALCLVPGACVLWRAADGYARLG